MTQVTLEKLQAQGIQKKYPKFKAGQTVRVSEKIKEGEKERIQIFEGLIIQTGGTGTGRTITVRKMVGGIGVEKIFSIHAPCIEKIQITKEAKVRRSKLFFMRDRKGKSARLREKFLTEKDLAALTPHEVTEGEINEAVVAQKEEEVATEEAIGQPDAAEAKDNAVVDAQPEAVESAPEEARAEEAQAEAEPEQEVATEAKEDSPEVAKEETEPTEDTPEKEAKS